MLEAAKGSRNNTGLKTEVWSFSSDFFSDKLTIRQQIPFGSPLCMETSLPRRAGERHEIKGESWSHSENWKPPSATSQLCDLGHRRECFSCFCFLIYKGTTIMKHNSLVCCKDLISTFIYSVFNEYLYHGSAQKCQCLLSL